VEILQQLEHAGLEYANLYLLIGGVIALSLHSANPRLDDKRSTIPLIILTWPLTLAVILISKWIHREE